ncbi:MAG: hypothetical protein AAB443_02205 [Patescibacteria group bacterium]
MLKIGHLLFYAETLHVIYLILLNSAKTHLMGIPPRKEEDLTTMAKNILLENLHFPLVYAGQGHFKLMWLADFAMAFNGLFKVIEADKLKRVIQFMINTSYKQNHVFTSYSNKAGFDAPYSRADSLPWLLHCVSQHTTLTNTKDLLNANRQKLELLLSGYEETYCDKDGLIKDSVVGDWIDTIKRPSSTWNNILALYTFKMARHLNLKTAVSLEKLEIKLLEQRYKDGYLLDYFDSAFSSLDSAVLALYLELFDKTVRTNLALKLKNASNTTSIPCAIKPALQNYPKSITPLVTRLTCDGYHSKACWPHLGLMYLNGLRSLNIPYTNELDSIEKVFWKHKNFVEVVSDDGNFFKKILTSDHSFTMAAGQYLELISA